MGLRPTWGAQRDPVLKYSKMKNQNNYNNNDKTFYKSRLRKQ
jgi:hypothetical protein